MKRCGQPHRRHTQCAPQPMHTILNNTNACVPIVASVHVRTSRPALACDCMGPRAVGVGEGVVLPSMNALVATAVPPERKASALGTIFSCFHCGNLVGLSLSPLIIRAYGWSSLFVVFGILGAPLLALWHRVLPSAPAPRDVPQQTAKKQKTVDTSAPGSSSAGAQQDSWQGDSLADRVGAGKQKPASTSGKSVSPVPPSAAVTPLTEPTALVGVPDPNPTAPVSGPDSASVDDSHDHLQPLAASSAAPTSLMVFLRHKATLAIVVANIVNHWGYFIFLSWIPVYFGHEFGLDLAQSALFAFVPWVAMALGSSLAGFMADALVTKHEVCCLYLTAAAECHCCQDETFRQALPQLLPF